MHNQPILFGILNVQGSPAEGWAKGLAAPELGTDQKLPSSVSHFFLLSVQDAVHDLFYRLQILDIGFGASSA